MASGFTQTTQSLKSGKQQTNSLRLDTATTNISAYASVIVLGIFDSGGNLVRKLVQKADSVSNFGVIVDSLASGTYTVVAAAGQKDMVFDYDNQINATYAVYYSVVHDVTSYTANLPWQDTFLDRFTLTVSNGPVNQTVPLTRKVGKLEVDFNDVIPASASRLDIEINKEDFDYYPQTGQLGGADTLTYHLTIPAAAKGTNTYKVSELVLNTATPFSVIITGYDSSNHVIATHTITNVTCTANQRTILTGNFSNQGQGGGSGFNMALDPVWSAPNTIHF